MKSSGILAFLVSIIFTSLIQAQSVDKTWEISLGYGLNIPVGDFKKITPEKSMALFYLSNVPDINGFDKNGNSAAQNGTSAFLKIGYRFHQSWGVNLKVGYSNNPVNTQPSTDYINNAMSSILPNQTWSIYNDDYQVASASLGAGYFFNVGKLAFSFFPTAGLAILESPDYTLTRQVRNSDTYSTYHYSTDQSNVKSFLAGLEGAILYKVSPRIYAGFDAGYNVANFSYVWTMKSVGLTPYSRSDEISYRAVQVNGRVSFRF